MKANALVRYVSHGVLGAVVMSVLLVIVLGLSAASDYDGRCGFLSEPCSLSQYVRDSFAVAAVVVAFGVFPFTLLTSLMISAILFKLNKRVRTLYVFAVVVPFIIAAVIAISDV